MSEIVSADWILMGRYKKAIMVSDTVKTPAHCNEEASGQSPGYSRKLIRLQEEVKL